MSGVIETFRHYIMSENPTLNLLMMLVIIWTTGVICRIVKQPPVLGELTAGIIFGPAFLGIIVNNDMVHTLSELGAFFLMFYAGLETDPIQLKKEQLPFEHGGCSRFCRTFRNGVLCMQSFQCGHEAVALHIHGDVDNSNSRERKSSARYGADKKSV